MESLFEIAQETTFFNLPNCLILCFILFCIGIYGVLTKRNLLIILMSIELMLNAVNLAFLSFNFFLYSHSPETAEFGQYFAILVIGVAAAEAAVGLAMFVAIYKIRKNTDSNLLEELKG